MGNIRYKLIVCHDCGKHFDPREEGFKINEKVLCSDCYHDVTKHPYRTL